jgi:hypothetical protein
MDPVHLWALIRDLFNYKTNYYATTPQNMIKYYLQHIGKSVKEKKEKTVDLKHKYTKDEIEKQTAKNIELIIAHQYPNFKIGLSTQKPKLIHAYLELSKQLGPQSPKKPKVVIPLPSQLSYRSPPAIRTPKKEDKEVECRLEDSFVCKWNQQITIKNLDKLRQYVYNLGYDTTGLDDKQLCVLANRETPNKEWIKACEDYSTAETGSDGAIELEVYYDSHGYKDTNKQLRDNPDHKNPLIDFVRNAPKMTKDITVYRGLVLRDYQLDIKDNIYTNLGFMSTDIFITKALDFARKKNAILMKINIPKGMKNIFFICENQANQEHELLINHRSQFRIDKVYTRKYYIGKVRKDIQTVELTMLR